MSYRHQPHLEASTAPLWPSLSLLARAMGILSQSLRKVSNCRVASNSRVASDCRVASRKNTDPCLWTPRPEAAASPWPFRSLCVCVWSQSHHQNLRCSSDHSCGTHLGLPSHGGRSMAPRGQQLKLQLLLSTWHRIPDQRGHI